MGTPRRYLPNMTYDAAQSLTQSESGMTCVAKAAEMIAKFVSEKISDTTVKVSVFFRHSQKPSKIEGVKLVGVDRDGDLSIKVTVQHSRYKIMYFALIQVSGVTGEELQKCLSQEGSPVMLHALRSAVDKRNAQDAVVVHSNNSNQREPVDTPKVVPEKKSSHKNPSKDGLPLKGFMKDETNVGLLLDLLFQNGVSERGMNSKDFCGILGGCLKELVSDPVSHINIMQTTHSLSAGKYIKRPQRKLDKWMFDVRAYEALGKPVPYLLSQTMDKERKPTIEKTPRTSKKLNGSLNGSSHPVASSSIKLSEVGGSGSADVLVRFINLKELLQREQNRLQYLEEEVEVVSGKISSIKGELDSLGDPQQLQSRLAELLK